MDSESSFSSFQALFSRRFFFLIGISGLGLWGFRVWVSGFTVEGLGFRVDVQVQVCVGACLQQGLRRFFDF